jgi:hypothetical protein
MSTLPRTVPTAYYPETARVPLSTAAFAAFPMQTATPAHANPVSTAPAIPPTPTPPPQVTGKRVSSALSAAGLIGLGLLLNRIPAKASAFDMVSTNIEDWAKMGLGVIATGKINDATNWQPQPWQHGLETVTVLTFISQGLRLKGWQHFPLLAVSVPALVQGTHWLNDKTNQFLDKHHSRLPRWIPKLAITLGSTVGGVYGLRGVMEAPWYRQATGKLSGTAGQQAMGAETLICSRCGGTHLVCMEEVSDFIGSMAGWFKEHALKGPQHPNDNPV